MRVLITGGAGFLGSHLCDAFVARGDEIFVLDTGSIAKVRHLLNHPRFHYVHDSIFNLELIDGLAAKADLIYHLAAVVGVEHYVADPYETLNVNVNGTQNMLKAAYKYGKRLVLSSTSEVYGRNPKVPWKEDDDRVLGSTTVDRWCYSTSKAVGEHFFFA
ncbi:MAG TPA: NAD-dependent epimerase/dehydratase family protein, partial [Candidatus Binataceae bacterium]|nr:NAD-dependent epimerase/dehydratase family protein [Candidatus Binataceae bacterium]